MKTSGLIQAKQQWERSQGQTAAHEPLTGFTPNTGGQKRFFDLVPLDRLVSIPQRFILLRGGIGCIAGETEISGIPVKELTESPIKVQTLMGETWATPAFVKGQANLYRVTTRSGKQVLTTGSHCFLSRDGWRQLQDLDCGAIVACHDNEGGRRGLGKSRDSQENYQEPFHCDGELLHPALVFALEQSGLLSGRRGGSPCNASRHSTGSFSQAIERHSHDEQHLYASNAAESLRHQLQSLAQFQRTSRLSCTSQLFDPSADRSCACSGHSLCQGSPHVSDKSFVQSQHTRQTLQQFQGSFDWLYRTQSQHHNQPIAKPWWDGTDADHFGQELFQRTICSLQESLHTAECLHSSSTLRSHACQEYSDLGSLLYFSGGNYLDSNSYWDTIEAIEYVRFDDFYDLHVPVANHYLANGFWHHNSGKSTAGAAFACSRALLDPSARGLITANSYSQLTTSTLISLAEFCDRYHVPLFPRMASVEETANAIANRRLCKIGDASVLVLSADAFTGRTANSTEAGRGLQARWVWADEWLYADASAFNTLNGRLGRGEGTMKGLGLITSSPNKNNPFNWGYDFFDSPDRDEAKQKIYLSINCPTNENRHLDADYVEGLQSSYTKELAAIELGGEYVMITTGKVFGYFQREKHGLAGRDADDFDYDASLPLHVGFDFNRHPATCLIGQQRGQDFFCIKEFYLLNSDTFQLSKAVCDWISDRNHKQEIYVYGDASGNSRTANSEKSNWQIVWAEFKKRGFRSQCRKRYGDSNPNVLDTTISVNSLFMAERLYILVSRCPELVKDLEQLIWKDDQIDKSDLMRSHVGDILRYIIHTMFPYKTQESKSGGGRSKQSPIAGLAG